MINRALISFLAAFVSVTFVTVTRADHADVVFLGDNIITMADELRDRQPTALAVKGEKILWIGAHGDHTDLVGEETEIVELGEQALIPGFIDAHGHLAFTAATTNLANVASPPVGPVTNFATLRQTLLEYIDVRNIEADEWVVGFGYDDSLLAENEHPTRAELDAVSTDHRIALVHVSGHLMAANSRALAAVGIDKDSLDPPGGHIRRDENGRPNGVLEESATYPFRRHLFNPANPQQAFADAFASYASYGVTTVQDGATAPEAVSALQQMAAAGALPIDVVVYPSASPQSPQQPETWPFGTEVDRLKVAGVKLMLDGSPQGKTAYLTKPYHKPPAGKDAAHRGYPAMPQAQLNQLVSHFLQNNIRMLAHANGDAAADMLIDAVAQGIAAFDTPPDHRTVMIHAQTVREDQVIAMGELQMIPSYFSAHTFYWGDWHRDSVLGDRAFNISPTAWSLNHGVTFTVHNDTPIVPSDMIRLLWATTNRKTRSDQRLGEAQRISVYAALKATTASAAYQSFDEARKGRLLPGMQADLVVLSTNPLLMPSAQLLEVAVRRTYSRGQLVHYNEPES